MSQKVEVRPPLIPALPRLSERPLFTSTGMPSVRSGPPRLQSFRPPAFDRGPPPLIAAPNRPPSVSLPSVPSSPAPAPAAAVAAAVAPASPNILGPFRPAAVQLSHFVNQNLPPTASTIIPPLVSVVDVPPPVARPELRPPMQPGTASVVAAVLPSPPVTTNVSSLTTSSAAGVRVALRPTTGAADLATARNVPVINVSLPRPVGSDSDHASPPGVSTTTSPSSLLPLSAVLSRQRLPLPSDIANRLDLTRPVSLKLSNTRVVLQPEDFIVTPSGVSISLPDVILNSVVKSATSNANSNVTKTASQSSPSVSNDRGADDGEKSAIDLGALSKSSCSDDSSIADGVVTVSSSSSAVSVCARSGRRLSISHRYGAFRALNCGAECLQLIFRCLSVRDLLQVSQVCRLWRCLAMQQHLVISV